MNEMTFDEAIESLQHAVYGEEVRYAIARALVLSMNTQQSVAGKEDVSNKVTSMDSNSTDTQYPSAKSVYNALSGKENSSNKVVSMDSNSTDVQYPSAKSVYNALSGKENSSNKKTTLTGNESSNDFYPTTKAVADALSTKAPASTAYTFDGTTTNVEYNANNPRIIYTRALVDSKNAIVLTTSGNYYQLAFCYDGTEYTRHLTSGGSTTYNPWLVVKNENTDNKKSEINDSNRTSTDFYPSIKAVVDYLAANYENLSNKLTSEDGINEDSTDTEYPTAKAVLNFGADILTEVAGDLVLKENLSNKKNAIAGNETSEQYYPTTKAVYDYGSQISSAVEDVKAYIGYTSGDILGLHCDFENKQFTRLGAAAGLSAGSDFDAFPMYGQRVRVVVDSDGEIQTDMDPAEITETDLDYDVMVYQPKFYYKVVPLKLEKQSGGLGYHIRKANYYITSTPHAGFRVHPLFIDKNGNEVDYVLLSAYEASYMYWHATSQSTGYYDIFRDGVDAGTTIDYSADTLKSLPDVKPVSGKYKAMTKNNMETLAQAKSTNWHLDTIQSVAANQLLMVIEYGTFNLQNAIGKGVVSCTDVDGVNISSLTGSTKSLGNATGAAARTIYDNAGIQTVNTTNGKVAVSYRGMENPWGNIFKHVNGINIWGDGSINGGQAYIAGDYSFDESRLSGNYKPSGFTLSNGGGWISSFGYGTENFDWLFLTSEVNRNRADSAVPVGDNCYVTSNLSENRIVTFGGDWHNGDSAGGFFESCIYTPDTKSSRIGGRLLFVPTAVV